MIESWVVAPNLMFATKMDMGCSMELLLLKMVALVILELKITMTHRVDGHLLMSPSRLKTGGNTTEWLWTLHHKTLVHTNLF